MNKLIKRRGWQKATITRAFDTMHELGSCSLTQLKHRLQRLEETYNELVEISQQLYDFEDNEGFIDPLNDMPQYENRYYQIYEALNANITRLEDTMQTNEPNNDTIDHLDHQQETFIERLDIATVQDTIGRRINTRLLLDSGSMLSLISENLMQRLDIKRHNARIAISGLASQQAGISKGRVKFLLFSNNTNAVIKVDALILPNLTSVLPIQHIKVSPEWTELPSFPLADPSYAVPATVDVLLGGDVLSQIYCSGSLLSPDKKMMAMNTILGWVLMGASSTAEQKIDESVSLHVLPNLNYMARLFMLSESIESKVLCNDKDPVEEHFNSTHYRDNEGRYVVRIKRIFLQ